MKNHSMEEQLKDLKRQNDEIMTQIKEDKEQREERINLFANGLRMIAIVWLIFGVAFLAGEFYDQMTPPINPSPKSITRARAEETMQKYLGEKYIVVKDKKGPKSEKVNAGEKWLYEKLSTITEK